VPELETKRRRRRRVVKEDGIKKGKERRGIHLYRSTSRN